MIPEAQPTTTSPQIGVYLSLLLRRLPWLMVSVLFFWAVGITLSLLLPPKFKSETVVLIEQPKVLPQYVAPNVATDMQQRMQSLSQQILSRTRLVRIMDTYHLYGKPAGHPAPDELVQRMRNDITIDLIKSGGRGDDLSAFKISYSAPAPALAQEVTGQITSLFIGENLHNEQQLTEDTTAFLEDQLKEARQDLESQEKVLGEFRSKHVGELPEQLASNVQILSGLQTRLQSATAALHQAEQQKLYLVSLIGQSSSTDQELPDEGVGFATTVLDNEIAKMKADLADLSARYTPEHPDIVRLKQKIASAEASRREGIAAASSGKKTGVSNGDGVRRGGQSISQVAQLQSQLKATDLEISNRQQEVKTIEAQIEQYQSRLNETPIREQELAGISRNHEQSQANYESLLAKEKQSAIVSELTKRQEGMQFHVLDPPSLPQKRYWPNPIQFGLAGVMGGLALGIAGIVFKEAVDPRVHNEDDLRRWPAAVVIGVVPPLLTPIEKLSGMRRRRLEIAATALVAVIIPVVTLMTYLKH
jgi:polysaccharide chain length determinant protein (PEP-CTERM system associated)